MKLTFETGSKLAIVRDFAFSECSALQSICIPSSIEIMAKSCFNGCTSLAHLTFEPGSEISLLGESAFVRPLVRPSRRARPLATDLFGNQIAFGTNQDFVINDFFS
jgi:hypothetical protein